MDIQNFDKRNDDRIVNTLANIYSAIHILPKSSVLNLKGGSKIPNILVVMDKNRREWEMLTGNGMGSSLCSTCTKYLLEELA